MTSSHDPAELSAHALGLLDGAEARAVEEHLALCPACRREWDELRDTSELLGDLPPEMFLDGPPDDDLVLQRALWQIRGEARAGRGRRTLGLAAAAVVAAAALAGGGVAIGRLTAPETVVAQPEASPPGAARPAPPAPGPPAPDPAGGRTVEGSVGAVAMSATVTPAAGWVRVAATVSGIAAGQRCSIIVIAADGAEAVAGSWLVSPAAESDGATVNGSAIVAPDDVAAIAVRNDVGETFISLPV